MVITGVCVLYHSRYGALDFSFFFSLLTLHLISFLSKIYALTG